MAISTATVVNAYDFQRLDERTYTISGTEYDLWTCKVDVEFKTVDYAQANDATITPATVIQNAKRDGKTVTVLTCAAIRGGVLNLAATPTVDTLVFAGTPSTISAGVITLPLTAEDLTTEFTNGGVLSTSVWKQPITVQIGFAQPSLS